MEGHLLAAELKLADGVDPREPGAAVTAALCGDYEHPPPCYWPHNNAIDAGSDPAAFRTVFAASGAEAGGVRNRVVEALSDSPRWRLVRILDRPATPDEERLGEKLAAGPRAASPLV